MAMPGMQHHMVMCEDMYRVLMGPAADIPAAVRLALNGLAWASAVWGLLCVGRLVTATLALERALRLHLRVPSAKLSAAVDRVAPRCGVDGSVVCECDIPVSYTSLLGLLRPRCIVSRRLVETATDEELDAVLAHELSHLRRGDSGLTFVVGALNCLFFFLRPVRLLSRRWREATELACDAAAARVTGKPLALAAAILRAHGAPVGDAALPAATLGFAQAAACAPDERVRRLIAAAKAADLEGEGAGPGWWQWIATLALALLGALALASPQVGCTLHCSLEVAGRLLR
jgi:hypothetical protein